MTNKIPKISDIARLAGVSTATVDRVLNRRPGVRPGTVQHVLKAARKLNYISDAEFSTDRCLKPMRITFLLPAGSNRVIHMFGDAIDYSHTQLQPFNVDCHTEVFNGFDHESLAQALLGLRGRTDGVVFMALEHPVVREAVDTLVHDGIPVVTLISDLSASTRFGYVGLDNVATGRLAAYLLSRLGGGQSGSFALIAGSLCYRAHCDRESGFLQLMQEKGWADRVIGLREGHDDAESNYRQTRLLLEQHADLLGIYNIGGAPEGVARALKEARRDKKIIFVGHGLTSDVRALLIDGTLDAIIMQDPQQSILNCVRMLTAARRMAEGGESGLKLKPMNSIVVFRENLP
ncbi:LacI family DNA-binding transcriptional regulator [Alcaligenes nematophilus]|uniref:LacI family DNA-binding transcriptional regulator n=1 Tax=Alcaligenes nematophilus TaxID=2994643 RepID=UPI00384B12F4